MAMKRVRTSSNTVGIDQASITGVLDSLPTHHTVTIIDDHASYQSLYAIGNNNNSNTNSYSYAYGAGYGSNTNGNNSSGHNSNSNSRMSTPSVPRFPSLHASYYYQPRATSATNGLPSSSSFTLPPLVPTPSPAAGPCSPLPPLLTSSFSPSSSSSISTTSSSLLTSSSSLPSPSPMSLSSPSSASVVSMVPSFPSLPLHRRTSSSPRGDIRREKRCRSSPMSPHPSHPSLSLPTPTVQKGTCSPMVCRVVDAVLLADRVQLKQLVCLLARGSPPELLHSVMVQAKEFGLWNEDQSIWQTASKDTLGQCFGYLDGSELLNTVELVCRKWRNCSQEGAGWYWLNSTCQLTNGRLASLKPRLKSLQSLRITWTRMFSPKCMSIIFEFTKLRALSLIGSPETFQMSDVCMRRLGTSLPNLISLTIRGAFPNFSDCGFSNISKLTHLTNLDLVWGGCMNGPAGHGPRAVTDASLMHLSRLTSLTSLSLGNALIRGPGLSVLAAMPRLKRLAIDTSHMCDAGLKFLVHVPNVTDLSLARTWKGDATGGPVITGDGLSNLTSLTCLQTLNIAGWPISMALVQGDMTWANSITSLTMIAGRPSAIVPDNHIGEPCNATKTLLKAVSRSGHLSSLTLDGSALAPSVLCCLRGNDALSQLSLRDCHLVDQFLASLGNNCGLPHLQTLDLSHNRPLLGDGLKHLATLPSLSSLDLSGSLVEDESLLHLVGCPSLKKVTLDEDQNEETLIERAPHLAVTIAALSDTDTP